MPASKAINTGDSSSMYWLWLPQKLSACTTLDFDEHTMERRRGAEEGWVSKVGALTAVARMQKKKSATSVGPLAVGWWALSGSFQSALL